MNVVSGARSGVSQQTFPDKCGFPRLPDTEIALL